MDSELSSMYDFLERILDEIEEPTNLPLPLLRAITNDFSDNQLIGIGGFAKVYKGALRKRMVAVKRLSKYPINEKYFKEEVHCLMRLKHKNIVRFLGYCADAQGKVLSHDGKTIIAHDQEMSLCFEYLSNRSLWEHITDASQGLEWRKRYRIIKGICQGLHYLHKENIVHLDLKPQNVLLDCNMVPKISDFGLSRCFSENQSRDSLTKPIGTLGYYAPELLNKEITKKSDIYSLGITIMEILTGWKDSTVEDVQESWNNRLEASQKDKQQEQVRVCAEVAIKCINSEPKRRPGIQDILKTLNATESMEGSTSSVICSTDNDPENRPATQVIGETKSVERSVEKGLDTSLLPHGGTCSTEYGMVLDVQLSAFFRVKAPLANLFLLPCFVWKMYNCKQTDVMWSIGIFLMSFALSCYQNLLGLCTTYPGVHGLLPVRLCIKMDCLSNVLRMLTATSVLLFLDTTPMMASWLFFILILPHVAPLFFHKFSGRNLTESYQEQRFGFISATQCRLLIHKAKSKVLFDLCSLVLSIFCWDIINDPLLGEFFSPSLVMLLVVLVPPAAVPPGTGRHGRNLCLAKLGTMVPPHIVEFKFTSTASAALALHIVCSITILLLACFPMILVMHGWGDKDTRKSMRSRSIEWREQELYLLVPWFIPSFIAVTADSLEDVRKSVSSVSLCGPLKVFLVLSVNGMISTIVLIEGIILPSPNFKKAWCGWVYATILHNDIWAALHVAFVHPDVMINDIYAVLFFMWHNEFTKYMLDGICIAVGIQKKT